MNLFTLRLVKPNDADALREIYNHAVQNTTATMDTEDRSPEEQDAWIAAHSGAPYPAIVAVAGDSDSGEIVVGYATLSPFGNKPGYYTTVENSLYVHPEWRGRGVGRLLLEALIADAPGRGFRSIMALVSADNEPSLRLHRSLGFTDVGLLRAVGYKHKTWVDVAYLQLSLGGNS